MEVSQNVGYILGPTLGSTLGSAHFANYYLKAPIFLVYRCERMLALIMMSIRLST